MSSNGSTAGNPDGGGPGTVDATPGTPDSNIGPGGKVTLTLEPFDVQAGTERQVCKKVNLPAGADLDAVLMHGTMTGTSHHLNIYKVLGNTTPVTPTEATLADCAPASEQLSGQAAYIFGIAQPEYTRAMPDGVGFHLAAGQQIILEQHVINATDHVIQGGAEFDMTPAADPTTIKHHADVIWMGNWVFNIPSNNTPTSSTATCGVPYDVEIFGLASHTHSLGVDFKISTVIGGGAPTQVYESTDWEHPPYQVYTPTIELAGNAGKTLDKLTWTCTWQNNTGHTVGPGKNSTDEMCITFAYAYPKTGLDGTPIQCNVPFQP